MYYRERTIFLAGKQYAALMYFKTDIDDCVAVLCQAAAGTYIILKFSNEHTDDARPSVAEASGAVGDKLT